ncbi:hypothetical protein FO519_003651 [Halicephalobus sp. NKZ332]|nr:hypothetical protein FO519_003651 [Halicephalobus sp. NKZ332]
MDLPDISRYLKSPNDSLKIQAFVSLIEKIEKENSSPVFRKLLDLIFESFQSSSFVLAESAFSWFTSITEKVLKNKDENLSFAVKEHLKNLDSLFTEVFSRVKKASHPEFLTKFGLKLVDLQPTEVSEDPDAPTGFHQSSRLLRLILSEKLPLQLKDVLISQFLDQEDDFLRKFELIKGKLTAKHFSKLIFKNPDVTRFFLDRLPSLSTDFEIPFSSPEFAFDVAEKLLNCSRKDVKILSKSGFLASHPSLLLPLFSVIHSNNQVSRVLKDKDDEEVMKKLSEVFKDCQTKKIERNELKNFYTVDGWFNWVLEDENRIDILLQKWTEWLGSEVPKKPNLKSALLLNLPKLTVNDLLTKQILKFLYVCSESDVWKSAFCSTRKLFEKNDWIFNEQEFQSMILIPKKEDSDPELIEEKFELLKSAALTESGEKLISKIITLTKTRPDLLEKSIDVITNLSNNEMIEIEKIREVLIPKVYEKGNEEALSAYCNFLGTSAVDEEEEEELVTSCVEELWKLRTHASKKVRTSAFRALSRFSKNFLLETLVEKNENENAEVKFLSGDQVFLSIEDEKEEEVLDGFKFFLKKCLEIDLDNLPRKIFVSEEKNQQTADSFLYTSLIPILRDTLQSPGFEWESLSLIEALTKSLMPAGKKVARCEQIFGSALKSVNPEIDLLKKLVILKNATEIIFENMMEANLALNKKFGVFDVLKSFTALLSKVVKETPESCGFCLFCLGFSFLFAQESLLMEAARDLSKQVFLQDHLESLASWKKDILDTVMTVVDENYTVKKGLLFKVEKVSSMNRYLGCLTILLLFRRQILMKEKEEGEYFDYCRALLESESSGTWTELVSFVMESQSTLEPHDTLISQGTLNSMKFRLVAQLNSVHPTLVELNIEKFSENKVNEKSFSTLKESMDLEELWTSFLDFDEEFQSKFCQQKVAQVVEKVEDQVVFELLTGLVSALGEDVNFPVELETQGKQFLSGPSDQGKENWMKDGGFFLTVSPES